MRFDYPEYDQAQGRIQRHGQEQNVETFPVPMNEHELQKRVTAKLVHKSDVTVAAIRAAERASFPEPEKPVQVVAAPASGGDYARLEERVLAAGLRGLRGAAENATKAMQRFSRSFVFPNELFTKEFLMEEETVAGMSTGEWAQVPKRKRRFHLNAEKRAATNWAGAMKMLKLLAPCGVQCNAQALDIINAKYGI